METKNLENEELNILYCLPFYVVVLVASADGDIDDIEIKKAVSAIKSHTQQQNNSFLADIYKTASEDTEDKLKIIISNSPNKAQDRIAFISKKITDTNPVLNKLDHNLVRNLHNNLCHLARQIAKASGGLLGYGSIGIEESMLLDLNLIEIPKLKD